MVAVAGEFGVRFLLVASGPAPLGVVADRVAALGDVAARCCSALTDDNAFVMGEALRGP